MSPTLLVAFTVVLSLQFIEIYLLRTTSMYNQPVTQNKGFFAR